MRVFSLSLLCLFSHSLHSAETKTICLNMIVKNESPVIERCLASVKGLIDYWVIVDTGSTDGTQQIIRNFMKDIPGELHERPWVNFGHNRTEALNLARDKADYLLFIDADEVLETLSPLNKEALTEDAYLANVRLYDNLNITFQRGILVNTRLHWSWKNVLHEKLVTQEGNEVIGFIPNLVISAVSMEGNRSQDPQKHQKDAALLEEALKGEPSNSEYVYYLAQAYNNCGMFDLAIKNYEKRAEMIGWDQHAFWSRYYAGVIREDTGKPAETYVSNYCQAFAMRPIRAEPLYRLANHYFNTGNFALSYILAQHAQTISPPSELLVEHWIYNFAIPLVLGNAALHINRPNEAKTLYENLLARPDLTPEFRQAVTKNLSILTQGGNL